MRKLRECFFGYYRFKEIKGIKRDLKNWCDLVLVLPSLSFGVFRVIGYTSRKVGK